MRSVSTPWCWKSFAFEVIRSFLVEIPADIFEEERELARQREEFANKARAEQKAAALKVVNANFQVE